MLKRRHFFTYKLFIIPSYFVVSGFNCDRFKNLQEIKKDIKYLIKQILAFFNKDASLKCSWYSAKSLSSFDYHIADKGAIVDNMGNVHTTAKSYKSYLKQNDLVIKDWADGSAKKNYQLSDRSEINKIVNKYLK